MCCLEKCFQQKCDLENLNLKDSVFLLCRPGKILYFQTQLLFEIR